MLVKEDPILPSLPEPSAIRSRLSQLATEANFLRALLRLAERNPAQRGGPREGAQKGGGDGR
jgi:hypothetical protein